MRVNNFTTLLILIPSFCVYAQKELSIGLNVQTEPIENGSIHEMGIETIYHTAIGTKNQLTNTFAYKNTQVTNEIESYVQQNYISDFTGTQFNSFENTLQFSHNFSEKTKLTLAITPTANFESTFESSAIIILGGIELNRSLGKNSSIDIGVQQTTVFGKPELLPSFSFNQQFSDKAYLKLGFPNSKLAYSDSIRNKFSLNNDFSGSSYHLNTPIVTDDAIAISKLGFSQIETTFQFERNIDNAWFLSFKAGYSSNKEFKFSNENRTYEINQSLKNGGVFSVNLKYKL